MPHLIVKVTPTSATMVDGDIVEAWHARPNEQQILPDQHLLDKGYVDTEFLVESQARCQVDSVGPVIPDTPWVSKEAERVDHHHVLIN